ncbi:MAG: glycosyl hydrolase-related protein, partial [Candidatus Sumerlaeia bacterium]|nr:glycosyl hydrolase-related protein [Candidatus Sumerlaeia bacterium]
DQFRLRLIDVIDELLEIMHTDRRFRWFVLDGQTVILEDYLEIKPQQAETLRSLIKQGRLFVGPLYTQPDEFLVSGEALIRNLLIGSDIACQFGRRMNIGYFPDCFGHIRQLPQILNGFGLDSFIFTRGMSENIKELGLEFIWVAPDGQSSVLAVNQLNGYGNFHSLGVPFGDPWHFKPELQIALNKADFEVNSLSQYARTTVLLLNNGIDHHPPQREIIDLIDYINSQRREYKLEHSNFERYISQIKKYKKRFKKFTGELRGGFRHWVLSGVYSSRLYLKQENEKTQILLANLLEPITTFLWLFGKEYPYEIILHLWKTLLKNHPHDDICGCSVDAVHQDMMTRFEQIQRVVHYLFWQYKPHLLDRIKLKPISSGEPIIVFNTLPWKRKFVYSEIEVFIPEQWVKRNNLCLVDSSGKHIYAIFEPGKIVSNKHQWGDETVQKVLVKFFAPEIPAMGFETFYVTEIQDKSQPSSRNSISLPALKLLNQGMENEFYQVTINSDGTLNIFDKETGLKVQSTHWFEDSGDKGDEYDYSPIPGDVPITTLGKPADKIELLEAQPHRICWRITHHWNIPAEISPERNARSKMTAQLQIVSDIALWAGKKEIDFRTRVTNNAKDHRLRCGFSVPFPTDSVYAESKFDLIKRQHLTSAEIQRQKEAGWQQPAQPTAPQDRFVLFTNNNYTLAFINQGLPEYEAGSTADNSYYFLTLLRCTGWISKNDLLTRSDHAGPEIPAPAAQCPGTYEMHYAFTSSSTRKQATLDSRQLTSINRLAMEFTVPIFTTAYESRFRGQTAQPILPERFSLFELTSDSPVLISAFKKAEKRDSIIVRLYNPAEKGEKITLKFHKMFRKVYLTRLDEKREQLITNQPSDSLMLNIPARKIITCEVIF